MTATDAEAVVPESVFERVHAVLAELPAIGKNNNAPSNMGGYAFRGIEDITAALKPLLAKHGVFMVPTVVDRLENIRTTANNKALYVIDLKVRFSFYGLDGDAFTAEMWGQGSDSGDKASQKAVTSAFKSMLAITFCISDSENDAERHDVPETNVGPPRATPEQKTEITLALRALDGELRAKVNAEVKEMWGPANELLASNVDEVLEHIRAAASDAAPFVANEDGTPAPTLIPSDNGDVRVKDTKAL